MRSRSALIACVVAIGFTLSATAKDVGRPYSARIRPGSGGEVRYILLSNEKSIVRNTIVAQGRIRELIIKDNGRRHRDLLFTASCASDPSSGKQMLIMYRTEPVFIDPTSTDVSMADQRHHDLWRAACKDDFSNGL